MQPRPTRANWIGWSSSVVLLCFAGSFFAAQGEWAVATVEFALTASAASYCFKRLRR